MAIKRRRATSKRARRPEPSRVVKITSDAAWEKLKQKHANSLIIVHLAGAFSKPSSQLRPYFAMYAKLPQYSHVTFAEIDVEQLTALAESIGVQACPTIACWRDGSMIQISQAGEGGSPSFIRQMLEAHAGEKPSAPSWRKWLLKGLVAAGAVAVAAFAVRSSRSNDASTRMAAVNEQIETLQNSISVARRRKQQKIVRQLAGRMERLTAEAKALELLAQQQGSSEAQLQAAGVATPGRGMPAGSSSSDDDKSVSAYTEESQPAGSLPGFSDEDVSSDDPSGYSSDHN